MAGGASSSSGGGRHILIACGGTGGHLFPGIAVAEALAARGHDATLLISEKKIDALAAGGHPGMRFEKMPFLALPRPWSPKMIGFLRKSWSGLKHCRALIRERKISAVLGMGGFTSTVPVLAGRKEKIRTFIHDSNSVPGKASKFTARFSDVILLGFEDCAKFFPKNETRVTGTPVRSALRDAAKTASRREALEFFKLNPGRKTLLVVGGSQGARGVNNAVMQSLSQLDALGLQILHLTGPEDYQVVRDAYQGHPVALRSHIAAFCHRMELAYCLADVALARSGASTLAELSLFGVPSILVPYPYAAGDHQTHNAEIFTRAGAAELVMQSELNSAKLATIIGGITSDARKHKAMKSAMRGLAHPDAAEKIAGLLVKDAR
jgi:UDP-N-acetylglucosamine--N-acetylmuramyl-(pentapeptide) pyrophosphoryl-undecaprenol N-acetylglucosamine transferase